MVSGTFEAGALFNAMLVNGRHVPLAKSVADSIRAIGVTEVTYYRRRQRRAR